MIGICAVMIETSCSALLPPKISAMVFMEQLYRAHHSTKNTYSSLIRGHGLESYRRLGILVWPIVLDEDDIPGNGHVLQRRERARHIFKLRNFAPETPFSKPFFDSGRSGGLDQYDMLYTCFRKLLTNSRMHRLLA